MKKAIIGIIAIVILVVDIWWISSCVVDLEKNSDEYRETYIPPSEIPEQYHNETTKFSSTTTAGLWVKSGSSYFRDLLEFDTEFYLTYLNETSIKLNDFNFEIRMDNEVLEGYDNYYCTLHVKNWNQSILYEEQFNSQTELDIIVDVNQWYFQININVTTPVPTYCTSYSNYYCFSESSTFLVSLTAKENSDYKNNLEKLRTPLIWFPIAISILVWVWFLFIAGMLNLEDPNKSDFFCAFTAALTVTIFVIFLIIGIMG